MTSDSAPNPPLPEAAYRRMAQVLRVGLAISGVLLGVALVAFVAKHPGITLSNVLGANPIEDYLTFPGLVSGVVEGHTQAYLTIAILVLVLTPLARVVTGLYYFARAKDRPLARISLAVLVLLVFGILVLGPLFR